VGSVQVGAYIFSQLLKLAEAGIPINLTTDPEVMAACREAWLTTKMAELAETAQKGNA
jgi:hypothetical protein